MIGFGARSAKRPREMIKQWIKAEVLFRDKYPNPLRREEENGLFVDAEGGPWSSGGRVDRSWRGRAHFASIFHLDINDLRLLARQRFAHVGERQHEHLHSLVEVNGLVPGPLHPSMKIAADLSQ